MRIEFPIVREPVNVDFMVKDAKRFADSGGWGYALFDYNAASDTTDLRFRVRRGIIDAGTLELTQTGHIEPAILDTRRDQDGLAADLRAVGKCDDANAAASIPRRWTVPGTLMRAPNFCA
jgi:Cytochrome P460